jgi:CubicO group peptidase (beta-lactamase class C family)
LPHQVEASAVPADLPVAPRNRQLEAALDRAFAEPARPQYRQVRAIVIMRDGQLVAERYAPGIAADTPLLGYSVSKSVVNALVGILVREGRLSPEAPAPVDAWNSPGGPRRAITLDELMRMTSGLDFPEKDTGLDPISRMMFLEPDMAAYAERASLKATPGTTWEYTSGNTLIVSSIIRDQVGGDAGEVLRFARRELFEPIGMTHVTMEFDHAGTPIGSTRIYASARDWARFGNLYQNDGVINGGRILPENSVAYSTRPTLNSDYGAGFWVNAGQAEDARGRVQMGMPADS